jgi:hypothetical protein
VDPRAGLDRRRKFRPLPGFDPRTHQPVAQSLYRLSYRAHDSNVICNNKWGGFVVAGVSWRETPSYLLQLTVFRYCQCVYNMYPGVQVMLYVHSPRNQVCLCGSVNNYLDRFFASFTT